MKNYTTYLLLFLCISCIAKKNTQESTLQNTVGYRQHDVALQQQRTVALLQDSGLRSWQFYADGPFLYHPDSGLRTAGGVLLLSERYANSQTLLQDSLAAQDFRKDSTHTQLETGKTVRQSRYPSWIGWALLAVLLFVIGWGIRQGQRI